VQSAGYAVPPGTAAVMLASLCGLGPEEAEDPSGEGRAGVPAPHDAIRSEAAWYEGAEVAGAPHGLLVFAFASIEAATRCAVACQRTMQAYNRHHETSVRLQVVLHARLVPPPRPAPTDAVLPPEDEGR
jgi:hypothetical protein